MSLPFNAFDYALYLIWDSALTVNPASFPSLFQREFERTNGHVVPQRVGSVLTW
jgi:hypothetical protein